MSTYGDILAVFPELLQEYDIFTMVPRVGGGYEHRAHSRIGAAKNKGNIE